jgi:hypothetical protein
MPIKLSVQWLRRTHQCSFLWILNMAEKGPKSFDLVHHKIVWECVVFHQWIKHCSTNVDYTYFSICVSIESKNCLFEWQLQSLQQGSWTCSKYSNQAKAWADQLNVVRKLVDEDDLISYIMSGFNSSYTWFITTFNVCYSKGYNLLWRLPSRAFESWNAHWASSATITLCHVKFW